MAALSETGAAELSELRGIRVDQLEPILREETAEWQDRLDWDFTASADLVRRFVRLNALSGYALTIGGQIVGYCYYVIEESKGLIGDLYILRQFATEERENRLLEAALETLLGIPYVRRVEAQLMMLPFPFDRRNPNSEALRIHQRNFMAANLAASPDLPPGPAAGTLRFVGWQPGMQEEAARVIAAAYDGHIDSEINDQYRSVGGARRFLLNIVQYPGCGTFFAGGSYVAVAPETGRLQGLCLSSLVASDVGHITQICNDPAVRGSGVGYELMRLSLASLVRHGCRKVSLTVTAENRNAIHLYERMGFGLDRTFAAYVWQASHAR